MVPRQSLWGWPGHLYLSNVPQVVLICSQGWEPLVWVEGDGLG